MGQASGRGTHAHGPIGSDHMLQSRGSEVAHAQAEKLFRSASIVQTKA